MKLPGKQNKETATTEESHTRIRAPCDYRGRRRRRTHALRHRPPSPLALQISSVILAAGSSRTFELR